MEKIISQVTRCKNPAFSLGVYRALYFGWLALYFGFFSQISLPLPQLDSTFIRPGLLSFFSPNNFSADVAAGLYPFFLGSLILTSLGLWTSFSKWAACLLGYWILGASFSNGVISHQDLPHFLILLVFALSDCGNRFSLDARFRKNPSHLSLLNYEMPIFLLRLIFVLVFFSAAIAKIKNGNIDWFLTSDMTEVFARSNLWFAGSPTRDIFNGFNVFLSENLWVARLTLWTGFIAELLAPLLFLRKARMPFLALLALSQFIGTFALYIDFFLSFFIVYAFWIPFSDWEEKLNANRLS